MKSPSSSGISRPEISLDFSDQISDISYLEKLPFLGNEKEINLPKLIEEIQIEPENSILVEDLSIYLYNRYEATVSFTKEVERQPCFECLETKNAIEKLLTSLKGIEPLCKDLNLVLNHSFVVPSDYTELRYELEANKYSANDVVKDKQALTEEIKSLQMQCHSFLESEFEMLAETESPATIQSLKDDEINAFNRAVLLLEQKDEELEKLEQDNEYFNKNKQEEIALIAKLQLDEQELEKEIEAYEQQADNLERESMPESSHNFNSVINELIHEIPVPKIEKDFISNTFAQPETENKKLLDILREAAYLLSKTLGQNNVSVEEEEFTQDLQTLQIAEEHTIEELNEIISTSVLIRYEIEACLMEIEPETPKEKIEQKIEIDIAPESLLSLKEALEQEMQSLFMMSFPTEVEEQNIETYKPDDFIAMFGTLKPEGFFDEELLRELSDLYNQVNDNADLNDLISYSQLLENILKTASRRCKIVQSQVVSLAESSFDLENELEKARSDILLLSEQISQIKQLNNEELSIIQDLEAELKEKESDKQALENQLNNQKNEIIELKTDNERISGLEALVKQAKKDVEELKFANSELEQKLLNSAAAIDSFKNELQSKNSNIESLTKELDDSLAQIRRFKEDQADLVDLKKDASLKNKELLALARQLEGQLDQSEAEVVELKKQLARDMPALRRENEEIHSLYDNNMLELTAIKEDLRQAKEQLKDFKLSSEQAEKRLAELTAQKAADSDSKNAALLQARNLEQEADNLAGLLAQEQEKAELLGTNLDQVSALNIQLDKQKTELIAEVETLKKELQEQGDLLQEVNAQLQNVRNNAEKYESMYFEQSRQLQASAQETAGKTAKQSMYEEQIENMKNEKEQLNSQLKTKQSLIENLQNQLSGLTMNTEVNKNSIEALMKQNFEKEIEETMKLEAAQYEQEVQQTENDKNTILEEYQKLNEEYNELQVKIKRSEKENSIYKEQIEQIEEIENKLANKSKKLLKTTNLLKQKCLEFGRSFERIATYTEGHAVYSACLTQTVKESDIMSVASLTQTAAPDEIHASDAVKIQMVDEEFLKIVCDLISEGLHVEASKKEIMSKEETIQEIVEEKEETVKEKEKFKNEIEDWKAKYQELKEQNLVMNNTITMLSQEKQQFENKKEEEKDLEISNSVSIENEMKNIQEKSQDENIIEDSDAEIEKELQNIKKKQHEVDEKMGELKQAVSDKAGGKSIAMKTAKLVDTETQRDIDKINETLQKMDNKQSIRPSENIAKEDISLRKESYEPSDSSGQQILNILHEYQPMHVVNEQTSDMDEQPENLSPEIRQPSVEPVSISIPQSTEQPEIASHFDESIRSFENKRYPTSREVSMLTDEEKIMIEKLLEE